jgi:CAAX protease family protein
VSRPAIHPRVTISVVLAGCAVVLFVALFRFQSLGPLDFWWWMSLDITLLCGLALALDRSLIAAVRDDARSGGAQKAALGLIAAAALYGVFLLGRVASTRLLPFAADDIRAVYVLKAGASPLRIALLLAFMIGPGEELFWRGTLQRIWATRFGHIRGYLLATLLYALVHLATGNIMLIAAAAVGGLFWGYLYLRTSSVLLTAVSHTAWDLLVFMILPL